MVAYGLRQGKNWLVAGMSGSGKSCWMERLVNNRYEMFDKPPSRVLWCYGVWQDGYVCLRNMVEFHSGLPSLQKVKEVAMNKSAMIILDDLMEQIVNDKFVQSLYTRYSHHMGITMVILSQNLFAQGRIMRTLSLNCHYILLFNNPRDEHQVAHLARQVVSHKAKGLVAAYEEATQQPHTYLLLDFNPGVPRELRFRSDIFPNELMTGYVPL